MAGEVCLDDVQILPTYSLRLNKTEASMFTGDTLELKAACSDGNEIKVDCYYKNPEIAEVEENGIVNA